MPKVYSIDGITPVVDPGAYVHPSAVLIGDVIVGALLGAVIGIFFGIAGLFVGPVIGAVTGEFIAGKRMIDAGRAGWGSLLGNLGAVMGKLFIALVMITIFLMTVPSPL